MKNLARRMLAVGNARNVFSSSITEDDIVGILDECLEETDAVLQDDPEDHHYGEYLTEYRSRFPD